MSWIDDYREVYENKQRKREELEKKKRELYYSCGTINNLKDCKGWIVQIDKKYLSMNGDLSYSLCDTKLRAIKFSSKDQAVNCLSRSKRFKDVKYDILFHETEANLFNNNIYMGD